MQYNSELNKKNLNGRKTNMTLISWNLEYPRGSCPGRHWTCKQTQVYNYLLQWKPWREKYEDAMKKENREEYII